MVVILVIKISLDSSSVFSCHLFLISSASVRFLPVLSFILPISAWNTLLVSLIFLKWFLVFPILLFSSISLYWSLRKAFLSLLAIFGTLHSNRYILPFLLLHFWFAVLIYISITFHKVESFSCDIFKNSVSKTEHWRSASWSFALIWFFSPNAPRAFLQAGVSSLEPLSPDENEVPSAQDLPLLFQKRPQGGSISLCCTIRYLSQLTFIFYWSRVDFSCVCFRLTGTWFNYT